MLLSDDAALDDATIQAAIAGDAEAFAQLFRRYHPMIHAFAYRLCLHPIDAQDVAQETFIKAARSIVHFQPRTPIRHWLYAICANAARDLRRGERRRTRLRESMLARNENDADANPASFNEIHDALGSLSDDVRATVVAVFLEGLSHAEAAHVLGCAETTVSWRIFIAKRKLKSLLTRDERR